MHATGKITFMDGLFLLLLPACLVLACASPSTTPPSAPPAPGVTDVAMQNLAFAPKAVTITQGDSVRWTNKETSPGIDHTATSGNPGDANAGAIFNSPLLHPGESFTFQFNTPGTYVYFCIVHALVMNGATVTVVPSGSTETIATPTPTPAPTTMPTMPGM